MIHMMRNNRVAAACFSVLALIILAGCGAESPTEPGNGVQSSAEVTTAWFELILDITRDNALSPPVASRAYGYIGTALYEAARPGMSGYKSLAYQLNDLEALPVPEADAEYHWPTVANAALSTIAFRVFNGDVTTASLQTMADLEADFAAQFAAATGQALYDRSSAHGRAIGKAIADWADGDGYAALKSCAYTPPAGEGLWVPTPPGFKPALEPCWGEIRTFVLASSAECDPGPPPAYSEEPESAFMIEALEVYETVNNLTDEERDIALFWADDPGLTYTPPGHWISILTELIEDNDWTLTVAAEAYAKVGIAQADAFIGCWRSKYDYNYIRPITCIQDLMHSGWDCPVNTPPFPEYTSGHSVQSGAAATVLTALFGDMAFTDHTHDDRGLAARSYTSFDEAALEAAVSRLYGGIHFRSAIDLGVEQGQCIGAQVNALEFELLQ